MTIKFGAFLHFICQLLSAGRLQTQSEQVDWQIRPSIILSFIGSASVEFDSRITWALTCKYVNEEDLDLELY